MSTEQYADLIVPVAQELLGEPNRGLSSKHELRYGSRGSLSIDVAKGTWYDHETGGGGGVLDLIKVRTGREGAQCKEWLQEHGITRTNGGDPRGRQATIVAEFPYTDEHGEELFQVVKLDPKDFRQRRSDGKGGWIWSVKGVRRVPYRLYELEERRGLGNPIFIVEGEKDVDNLWKINAPATTNAGGAGKWHPELTEYFRNVDVIIIPDFDPPRRDPKTNEMMKHDDGRPMCPGQDHAQDVAAALVDVARSVRVLELWEHWREMPLKGDVSDWLEHVTGDKLKQLYDLVDITPLWTERARFKATLTLIAPLSRNQESQIPRRDWVVPGLLMRGQVTVLVAPSGSGKSLLTLQLGIACAQGEPWAGWVPVAHKQFRVLVINSEDNADEMQRRLMAATYKMNDNRPFDWRSYLDNFRMIDGTKTKGACIIAKFDPRTKALIATPLADQIIATVENRFDIIFVDPFAETFIGDENSNQELKQAGEEWREIARRTNAAVCLIHHTRKYASGMAGDVDAARGASALIGIARVVSTLFPMTIKEAEAMGVKEEHRPFYLRYDDAKANLNVISPFAKWFVKDTRRLNNAGDGIEGDDVGVLVPWRPKGPVFTEQQINAFFVRVDQGILDDDDRMTGEYYTFEKKGRGNERYIGIFTKDFFGLDAQTQADSLIEGWRKSKRLQQVEYLSPKGGRHKRQRVISELSPDCPKNKGKTAPTDQGAEFDFPSTRRTSFQILAPSIEPCAVCGQREGVYLIRDPFRAVASNPLHEGCAAAFYRREK